MVDWKELLWTSRVQTQLKLKFQKAVVVMNVLVKKVNAIVMAMVAVVLIASSPHNKIILYDSCDYLEINNIYKIDDKTGKAKLRLVQYVWWEWRDSLLVPVLNPYTRQKTGLSKQISGFAVREYIVVENNYLKPSKIIHTSISKTKRGWVCIYEDFARDKIREISFKWMITTHTLYDSELNNRDIVALEHRNKFIKR
jgi:hypothetical protein